MARYDLDLVKVKVVTWDECCSQPADDFTFLYGNGSANHHLGTRLCAHEGNRSAVERV